MSIEALSLDTAWLELDAQDLPLTKLLALKLPLSKQLWPILCETELLVLGGHMSIHHLFAAKSALERDIHVFKVQLGTTEAPPTSHLVLFYPPAPPQSIRLHFLRSPSFHWGFHGTGEGAAKPGSGDPTPAAIFHM